MIDRAYCVEEFGLLNQCNPVNFSGSEADEQ
jgi:hypothetical protein